jgi:hypothetical protein
MKVYNQNRILKQVQKSAQDGASRSLLRPGDWEVVGTIRKIKKNKHIMKPFNIIFLKQKTFVIEFKKFQDKTVIFFEMYVVIFVHL